ncbi:Cap15 family cyclic dinucleotide receptor domain-containing protein [Lentzea terrae]|uniref:Cap15 family cyclic dinucleotide receptor domain-containing protein n=1 Tax=Lentzea terrae TaxID=2200761 RepID=UPI0013008DC5
MTKNVVIRTVVGVAVLVFVVGAWIKSGQLDLGWLKYFSIAVLTATAVLALWDIWLWRLDIIQLIPGVPRSVRGTWQGTLTSFWVDPETDKSPDPKTVYLVVRQSSSHVSVTLLTNESRSTSSLAAVSEVDGTSQLTYLYLNRPDARFEHRSRIHHGSTALIASGNKKQRRLKGRYWTDRDTKGELDFTKHNTQIVDDFDEAGTLFK